MPSPCAAVKYCFPAPMERRVPMRSLRSLAATPRPCATSSIIIHKFNRGGLQAALRKGSRRPHTTPHKAFDEDKAEALRQMLHQSPRKFGKDSTLWTLEMAAQASFEEDLTQRRLSGETIRATLARMGVRWQRAKRWITSPDPEYERKKV